MADSLEVTKTNPEGEGRDLSLRGLRRACRWTFETRANVAEQ